MENTIINTANALNVTLTNNDITSYRTMNFMSLSPTLSSLDYTILAKTRITTLIQIKRTDHVIPDINKQLQY